MRTYIVRVVAVLCWTVLLWGMAITVPDAVAQTGDAPGPGQRAQRRGGQPGRSNPSQEIDRIHTLHEITLQEMDLSDQQAQGVDNLFAAYVEAASEHAERMEATREKNAAQIEKLEKESAEARTNRDRDAMRRIHEEMSQATGADGTFAELRRGFFADMMDLLGEEQGRAFRRLAAKSMRSSGARDSSAMSKIHALRRALVKMELPREQKKAAMKHFKGLKERVANAREQGEAALANLAAELREGVASELDEEQIAALDKALAEAKDQRGQRSRKALGGRPGKTSAQGESDDQPVAADDQQELPPDDADEE